MDEFLSEKVPHRMSEPTSKFPHQLFSFFRRYTDQNTDDEALSVLQKLYTQLQAGHASVQIQPTWNEIIKSLKSKRLSDQQMKIAPLFELMRETYISEDITSMKLISQND